MTRECWLGGRDSNPDSQIQSLESYHWTTSQQQNSIYGSLIPKSNAALAHRRITTIFTQGKIVLALLESDEHNSAAVTSSPRFLHAREVDFKVYYINDRRKLGVHE